MPSICEIGGGRGWAGEEARGERRGPVLAARGLRGVSCVVVELLSVEVLRCSFGVSGAVVADDVGLRGWTTDAAATFGRVGCWPLLPID